MRRRQYTAPTAESVEWGAAGALDTAGAKKGTVHVQGRAQVAEPLGGVGARGNATRTAAPPLGTASAWAWPRGSGMEWKLVGIRAWRN